MKSTIETIKKNTSPPLFEKSNSRLNKYLNNSPLVFMIGVLGIACVLSFFNVHEYIGVDLISILNKFKKNTIFSKASDYSVNFIGFTITTISIMILALRDNAVKESAENQASNLIKHSIYLVCFLFGFIGFSFFSYWGGVSYFYIWIASVIGVMYSGLAWSLIFFSIVLKISKGIEAKHS